MKYSPRRKATLALAAAVLLTLSACGSSPDGADTQSTSTPSDSVTTPTGSAQSGLAQSDSASTPAFPATVPNALGDTTVPAEPAAIISLSPSSTEILFGIGAGDQVVAVDKYSDYPAGVPDTDIDAMHLSIESLAEYSPDLVVMSNVSDDQSAQFEALGLTVLSFPSAHTLSDSYDEIAALGVATGHVAGATELTATMKSQIASIVDNTAVPDEPITYYYELMPTYYSATSDTFIGQLFSLIGLASIADAATTSDAKSQYPQLDAEYIFDVDPDIIFLADTTCCSQSATTVAARPGWSDLTAVSQANIAPLDDSVAKSWGPRLVDLLRSASDAVNEYASQQ